MFSAATKSAAPVSAAKYIENFFQTWLRTGTGASATITTGLDASTNKALVWTKSRSAATDHKLTDTVRGATKALISNTTGAQTTDTNGLTAFSSTGYTIGTDTTYNNSGATYVDWEFVATPKFFDVVTYTGNGTQPRTITHNLGSVPGCIIVKRTDSTSDWAVYHRAVDATNPQGYRLELNTTNQRTATSTTWNNQAPTSTEFYIGSATYNASGGTYVAYLFAHDAGGFGLTGSDNVISCGSFTTDGSGNATVSLGYEPQWMMTKATTQAEGWYLNDTMRGYSAPNQGATSGLAANSSAAEAGTRAQYITATGFTVVGGLSASQTYIYIAIRRGPMKTPTSGTSVYEPVTYTGNGVVSRVVSYSLTPDSVISGWRSGEFIDAWANRLTNKSTLNTQTTAAELNNRIQGWDVQNGLKVGEYGEWNANTRDYINWVFKRAPGFFDVVNVVTNGQTAPITSTHNLTVVPEMMIAKKRGPTGGTGDWCVYHKNLNGGVTPQNFRIRLNQNFAASAASGVWNNTAPTATQFTLGTDSDVNSGTAGDNTIVYLFASCPGVSSVGSYTGTGALQTINCGFTSGARFVLIKRTDSTGDWYVYDSARGITSGNDPYLFLNSTAAEVTGTNYVDTDTTGFKVTAAAPAGLNASGGTYIFLAIA